MQAVDSSSQIAHMRTFILHEASEKADEINVKAEQDYTMEKQRVVEEEKLKIRKEFERRERGLNSQAKIDGAKELSKARISVLTRQADLIQEIVSEARSKLATVTSDQGAYTKLLVGLMAQGLEKLNEDVCLVRCRAADKAAVMAAIPQAIQAYSAKDGAVPTSIEVMPDPLPNIFEGEELSGGVLIMNKSGKIKVNNTFNARLAIAAEQLLPQIKFQLFPTTSKINVGAKDFS